MPNVSAVYAAAGKEYVVTDEDAIWLARMIVGEGGFKASTEKVRALIWAIMNRYLLLPSQRKRTSLKSILQAFSQPINPRWNRHGDFCRPGGKWHNSEFCEERRLDRRDKISKLKWDDIPSRIQHEIELYRQGSLPLPKAMETLKARGKPYRINNWASLKSTPKKFPWGINIGDDWFFEDKGTLDADVLINGIVQRVSDSGAVVRGLLPGLAIGGAVGLTVYYIAKAKGFL